MTSRRKERVLEARSNDDLKEEKGITNDVVNEMPRSVIEVVCNPIKLELSLYKYTIDTIFSQANGVHINEECFSLYSGSASLLQLQLQLLLRVPLPSFLSCGWLQPSVIG